MMKKSLFLSAGLMVLPFSAFAAETMIVDFDNQLKATAAPVLGNLFYFRGVDTTVSGSNVNVSWYQDPTQITGSPRFNVNRVAKTVTDSGTVTAFASNPSQAFEMRFGFSAGTIPPDATNQQNVDPLACWLRVHSISSSSQLIQPVFDYSKYLKIDVWSKENCRLCFNVKGFNDLNGKLIGESAGPTTLTSNFLKNVGGPTGSNDQMQPSGLGRGGFQVTGGVWQTIYVNISDTPNITYRTLAGAAGAPVPGTNSGNLLALEGIGFTPDIGVNTPVSHVVIVDNIRNGDLENIAGTANLLGLSDPALAVNYPVTFTFRDESFNQVGSPVTINVAADGSYSFASPVADGVYYVSAKAGHWLSKRLGKIKIRGGQSPLLVFNMLNGDVDSDDVVSVFDYIALSDAFDADSSSSNWNPNADLDGDGVVSVFDYIILSDNFDLAGDDSM